MPKTSKSPADYILPLDMNGLSGRMLRLPPPANKKREVMFVYGHHASLERWFGVAEYLNKSAGVTIPDLPGFGGMDPFYKIGEKPTLDNLADYLASFIKFRYRKQKFTIIGLSLGFMVVTRMLQKYPELTKQVEVIVSFAGFTNKKDFRYKKSTYLLFRCASSLFALRLPAAFIKYCVLRGPIIRMAYKVLEPRIVKSEHSKMQDANEEEFNNRVETEIVLWECNDARTYFYMGKIMFKLNLQGKYIDLPVNHLAVDKDRYFDNFKVEEHMRQIYKDYIGIVAKVPNHSPSTIANADEAAPYFKHIGNILNKIS